MSEELSSILKEGESSLGIELDTDGEKRIDIRKQVDIVYAHFSLVIYPKLLLEDYSTCADMKEVYSRVDDIIYEALVLEFGENCVIIKNLLSGLSDIWALLSNSRGEDLAPLLRVIGSRSRVVSNPALAILKDQSGCPFDNGKLSDETLWRVKSIIKEVSPKLLYKKGVRQTRVTCQGIKFHKDLMEKITEVYALAESQI